MLIALIFVALILLLVALEVAANFLSGPRLRKEVVVATKSPDDKTIRGILVHRDRRWIRLESPRYGDGEADEPKWIPLEGALTIPAGNISYIQVL